jgi:hypothetical protein
MCPDTLRVYEVWGIWFTGIATFSAAFVALFLQWILERRRRPRLKVEFDSSQRGDKRYLPPALARGPGANEREELWVRLRVRNTTKTSAKDVELRFIGAQREGGQARESRPSWWFKASNLNEVSVVIPPQFPQYFDLAYVKNVVGLNEDVSLYLTIVRGDFESWLNEKLRIEREEENNRLEIGFKYDLFFVVVCSNADASFYRMELKVLPHRIEDPLMRALLGEKCLMDRVEVISLNKIAPEEAFPVS